ncbi:sodium:solute symporter family protein [Ferribacterium limneticum]|uniref:sodium:solute symporter family protein n=1 Tax=Ferribacterium limneticum TaxID=76259 RepID=UPI001CFB0AD3|nr:sodium:solute symporter family protein [Ferribacterium limneticum]UCV27079.1 cation acetate symporter [Ferribacterium limneticum]UCV30996.1 cation acetate symporter [Ferribacterium limneticum]
MLSSLTRLQRYYLYYTGCFLAFIGALAILEQHGMPPRWIGYSFLFFTISMYALIGIVSRTSDVSEYYVAGRKVPAFFNGMATGADWMSAASFIGMAGTLYLSGFQGLAYVIGWTGGFVLVALLLAPYLRRFGQYTIPDFLGARYGGNAIRLVAVGAAILASFVYVVAQIYGVGVITSRFVSLQFEIGVFVGLAGILVCSFLGGMKAVTWTQVAQYLILIVAYVTPVAILSYNVTGNPIPQLVYGQVLQQVTALENRLFDTPAEVEVRQLFKDRADLYAQKIMQLPHSLTHEREQLSTQINQLKASDAQMKDIVALERQRRDLPHDPDQAKIRWENAMFSAADRSKPPIHHGEAFPGETVEEQDIQRINFLALIFCLTVGTAALPHVLTRYYTTPSVREARESVFWSLLFILLLYITAPAYAVFAKYEVLSHLAEIPIAKLPGWVAAWAKIGLVSIEDINADGILQLAELSLNPDVIVLATPEIAGMPYVVSGLVAAGGLAAALSTADGLLLTITSALSHDVYYRIFRPDASTQFRLVISKSMLLVVAVLAATVAAQKPGTILSMVAWAFSIAGSAFFPALVLGIFWERATRQGALAGMIVGVLISIYYIVRVEFDSIPWLGISGLHMDPWFHIQATSSGFFGVLAGFATIILVSLVTKPEPGALNFLKAIRFRNDTSS